jgi:hypothetical protein
MLQATHGLSAEGQLPSCKGMSPNLGCSGRHLRRR